MKKIIILTTMIGAICTFFIYKFLYHEDINIVTLGDGISLGKTAFNVQGYSYNDYLKDYFEENSIVKEYITEFSSEEETTTTLLLKLQTNYTLESTNTSITQAISKAKILTISLGMYELNNKDELTSPVIDKYIENMEKIVKMLRINNKKDIFLLSLYSTSKIKEDETSNINNRLKDLCIKYNITFIDISEISKNSDYFFTNTSYFVNYKAHRFISEKIIDKL